MNQRPSQNLQNAITEEFDMWIKIEEGLPLPLQKVLITVENHGIRFVLLAWFSNNGEWLYLDDKTPIPITHKIIAWQLFPRPFQG